MGWIYKTIDFCAGIPFLVAGFVFEFGRNWFRTGRTLHSFCEVMNTNDKEMTP